MFNMPMMTATPSLADIAAVTGNRNEDGWGNGGGWWAWILLFAIFGGWGWGGNGYGNRGGCDSCNDNAQFIDAAVQRGFDHQSVISKLDGITNGICNLGYDQLGRFNSLDTLVMQTGFGLQQAVNNNDVNNMRNTWQLSQQVGDCCCNMKQMFGDLKYDMATSDCSIKTLMNQLFQQLQWGQMNGIRDLSDLINQKFCELSMQQKDATIAELQAKLNTCDRDGALMNLYNMLTQTLRPQAVPAYPACNPNGVGNWAPQVLSGNGWNNCGCGNCCNTCC